MDLDPYEYRLYLKLKRIAGDIGSCYMGVNKLADACKMGRDKLIKCKHNLCLPREILNGKPLIRIEKRLSEAGDKDSDLITITDIWPENYKYFCSLSSRLPSRPERPQVVGHVDQGSRPRRHKEEHLKKEPEKEEHLSSAGAAEEICKFFLEEIRKKKPNFAQPNLTVWTKDFDLMMRIDKRELPEIMSVILWVVEDSFWFDKVLCPSKLRKQFDALQLKMKAEEEKNLIRKNREWALNMKDEHPEPLKGLSFDDKYVCNRSAGKEIAFAMNHEAFKTAFAAAFGARRT
jgi:hypothetical protein